ncbi:MAG: hypothetical protein KTR31_20545 [Myxococcales bacterium]|nr:hypothetical protein [Myxococcales bacterium]
MRAWLLLLAACGPKRLPEAAVIGRCDGLMAGAPATAETWAELVTQVQRATLPELDDAEIELVLAHSSSSFLWANVRPSTLLRRRDQRIYRIHYTDDVFDGLSRAGQVAIVAHELEHVRHYTHMRPLRLVGFGLWYVLAPVARYERRTDELPLQAGCGPGLADYRRWQQPRVSPRVARKKRRNYLTPEQIEAWRPGQGAP